ncbi:hypothetical protein D3C83_87510 [compost metagenome]
MSKHRKPVIPDFSKKAKPKPGAPRPDVAGAPRPPVAPQSVNVKPQATNSKSGRRGS